MPWFFRSDKRRYEALEEELKAALANCEDTIDAVASEHPETKGMGTTLTLGYVLWPRLYLVHAGDSRAYLYRERTLEQLTKDHTVAQQLADRGVEVGPGSRWRDTLSNMVGSGGSVAPEVHSLELRLGDTLLLCTDGLTKHVSDDDIAGVLERRIPAVHTCDLLVRAANDAGGSDNITVVVAKTDAPTEEPNRKQTEETVVPTGPDAPAA